jgi:hypothetical protein
MSEPNDSILLDLGYAPASGNSVQPESVEIICDSCRNYGPRLESSISYHPSFSIGGNIEREARVIRNVPDRLEVGTATDELKRILETLDHLEVVNTEDDQANVTGFEPAAQMFETFLDMVAKRLASFFKALGSRIGEVPKELVLVAQTVPPPSIR